jgi:Fic family protein
MSESRRPHADEVLVLRICGEFLEMPGVRLTCAQAQRLFGLNEDTCRRVLEALVADDFLARAPGGMYVMPSSGPGALDAGRRKGPPTMLRRTA